MRFPPQEKATRILKLKLRFKLGRSSLKVKSSSSEVKVLGFKLENCRLRLQLYRFKLG
jgi:hypothetical protein